MKWPTPKFEYAQRVNVIPLEGLKARIVELHIYGIANAVEYDVRYFHEGKSQTARVFEDELEADDG